MAKLGVEVKLTELEEVRALLEEARVLIGLLADNVDCMSEPLKSKFKVWCETEDKGWISWSDISPEFINSGSCSVMLNGSDASTVCGYNKALRKVKVFIKDANRVDLIDAKTFSINNIGQPNFVEWS